MSVLKLGAPSVHRVGEIAECHTALGREENGESGLDDDSGGPWRKVWCGEEHQNDASKEKVEPKTHGGYWLDMISGVSLYETRGTYIDLILAKE